MAISFYKEIEKKNGSGEVIEIKDIDALFEKFDEIPVGYNFMNGDLDGVCKLFNRRGFEYREIFDSSLLMKNPEKQQAVVIADNTGAGGSYCNVSKTEFDHQFRY